MGKFIDVDEDGAPVEHEEEQPLVVPAPNVGDLMKGIENLTAVVSNLVTKVQVMEREQGKLPTWEEPSLKNMKAGEEREKGRTYIPANAPPIKFKDGDVVRVVEGTEFQKLLAADGWHNVVGTVYDRPMQLTPAGEWKYRVKFEGIGKDSCQESLIELA